ncbi:MAG: hypothetical protein WCO97_05750 [bacterium]
MTKRDWVAPSRRRRIPAALPNLKAISGVMGYRFAVPRMPSVPNSLRPDMMMIGYSLSLLFGRLGSVARGRAGCFGFLSPLGIMLGSWT